MQSSFYPVLTIVAVAAFLCSHRATSNSLEGFSFQCGETEGSDVFKCDGDNVVFTSPDGGDLTLQPGEGGNVKIGDLVLNSSPPIWKKHFNGGNLGVYGAYSDVSISIGAEDPEGGPITYSIVYGTLPPGLELEYHTGKISGTAPGFQALFSFGVQATDEDGRTADAVFTIDILESYYHCSGDPCENNATCIDGVGGGFYCHCPEGYYGETCRYPCVDGYGGSNCTDYCLTTPLGVSDRDIISDDQMTAYSVSSSSFRAWEGRLGYSGTWRALYSTDWLQIDFISLVEVYRVAAQGYSSYGVTKYYLRYSNGGKTFTTYTNGGSTYYFLGYGNDNVYTSNLPAPVEMTHIRFVPYSYDSASYYLRVEVYGCYVN